MIHADAKRKPATVDEILVEEFLRPMGVTQGALADAMGVPREHVNELCDDRRAATAPTALILARVFGNSPDFWLKVFPKVFPESQSALNRPPGYASNGRRRVLLVTLARRTPQRFGCQASVRTSPRLARHNPQRPAAQAFS